MLIQARLKASCQDDPLTANSMIPPNIPTRASSRYSGQYAGTVDAQRLMQIFTESMDLALSSKNVETATSRYELAIEAFHQMMTLPLSPSNRLQVQESMAGLTAELPLRMCMNEAQGLSIKAAKLKTPKRKLELLRLAFATLERGRAIGLGGSQAFQDFQAQIAAEIAAVEALVSGR